jgi:hypothetical protein
MAEETMNIVLDPFSGALGAAVGAILVFLLVFFLAYYIYSSLAMMRIAQRIGTRHAWLAWIPIANIYLMTQMVGISGWWTFAIFAAAIPGIGGPLLLAGMIYLYWMIAEKVGRPGWWGILMILPIVNLVIIGLMAWGRPERAIKTSKAPSRTVSRKPVKKGFKRR